MWAWVSRMPSTGRALSESVRPALSESICEARSGVASIRKRLSPATRPREATRCRCVGILPRANAELLHAADVRHTAVLGDAQNHGVHGAGEAVATIGCDPTEATETIENTENRDETKTTEIDLDPPRPHESRHSIHASVSVPSLVESLLFAFVFVRLPFVSFVSSLFRFSVSSVSSVASVRSFRVVPLCLCASVASSSRGWHPGWP